jgi:uncharacterized protein YciI
VIVRPQISGSLIIVPPGPQGDLFTMYVAVICADHPDSVTLRMDTRPDHLAFLKGLGPKLKLGGALTDDAGDSPEGSLVVLEVASIAEARTIMAEDPYAKAGLFQSVTFKPWKWMIGNPDLASS